MSNPMAHEGRPTAAPPCPSWCEQHDCEWVQYDDHQKRWHGLRVGDMHDQLSTLAGPGILTAAVEISAAERFDVDWERCVARHRLGEPMVFLSIASRGPANAAGGLPAWDESLTALTADQARRLVGLLTEALGTLDAITTAEAGS